MPWWLGFAALAMLAGTGVAALVYCVVVVVREIIRRGGMPRGG